MVFRSKVLGSLSDARAVGRSVNKEMISMMLIEFLALEVIRFALILT